MTTRDDPARAPRRPDAMLARRGGVAELLWLPAVAFAAAAGARRKLYDKGLLPVHRVDVPVACVGNLTAGGTGKSPLVRRIVAALRERGIRAAVLSRGYRRRGDQAGDEARELRARFPELMIQEDEDRVRGARSLVAHGAEAIVLDDGFQHRRLGRDLDVLLFDATRPFGLPADSRGRYLRAPLPRGLMREGLAAAARADALVVTRVDQVPEEALAALEARLAAAAPGLPLARARHAPRALLHPDGREEPVDSIDGVDVAVASGVGNPESFERTLRGLGACIAERHRYPDHHEYDERDARTLRACGLPVITTRKDAVKLARVLPEVLVLDVEIELVRGGEALDALVESRLVARALARRNA